MNGTASAVNGEALPGRLTKRVEIPIQTRLAEVGSADPDARTVDITWTTGAAVKRMDFWSGDMWIEELSVDPASVRMGRMQSGAPLLNTHARYDLSGVLGVVENAKVDGSKGTATVRFSKRADVEPIFQDVKDRIIRNVSVGYTVYRYDDVSTPDDLRAGTRRMRATDWEPSEVSLVPVGADPNAGVRSASTKGVCEIEYAECGITIDARAAETIALPVVSDESSSEDGRAAQAAPPAKTGGVTREHLLRIQHQSEVEN